MKGLGLSDKKGSETNNHSGDGIEPTIRPFLPSAWLDWWDLIWKQTDQNQKMLKEHILSLSTHYQQRESITPWEHPMQQLAYLCYFMPLNQLRLWAALNRLTEQGLHLNSGSIIEVGSGPGTSAFSLGEHPFFARRWQSYLGLEPSKVARDLHRQWFQMSRKYSQGHDPQDESKPANEIKFEEDFELVDDLPSKARLNESLLLMQTSLNELNRWPSWFFEAQEILVIEAGHRLKSRLLIDFRKQAIDQGYSVWAPCTHQMNCPMAEVKTDWCHDRFELAEADLPTSLTRLWPLDRQDLSFSYLYLKRNKSPERLSIARVTGDLLVEKGKSRQLICRSEKREFLSWLHRQGKPNDVAPRGSLISLEDLKFTLKGTELRIDQD